MKRLFILAYLFTAVFCSAFGQEQKENRYKVRMKRIQETFNELVSICEKNGLMIPEKLDSALALFRKTVKARAGVDREEHTPEDAFALRMLILRMNQTHEMIRNGLEWVGRYNRAVTQREERILPDDIKTALKKHMDSFLTALSESVNSLAERKDIKAIEYRGSMRTAAILLEFTYENSELTVFIKNAERLWKAHLQNPRIAGIVKNINEEFKDWQESRNEYLKTRTALVTLDTQREIIDFKARQLELALENMDDGQWRVFERIEQQIEHIEEEVDMAEDENEEDRDNEGDEGDQDMF